MVGEGGLKELLKRVKSAEDVERLKAEIKEVLSGLSPTDLALAEQELIAEGISPDEIRKLCEPHLELLREWLGRAEEALEPLHPIRILKNEHDIILQRLDDLRQILQKAEAAGSYDRLELEKLRDIAEHLIEAESHHRREEEALFPELERRGVTGPSLVMRMEHEELRVHKRALKELVENYKKIDYREFVSKFREHGGYIVENLNSHIFKENNILYPTALQTIEEKVWPVVKKKFDEIGYCCFTPGFEAKHHHS